jgi:hypothetical protein
VREKYVLERFRPYFVFGQGPNGHVDISDGERSTVATVTSEEAGVLIADRDAVLTMLSRLALRFAEVAPAEFDRLWFGKEAA